MTAAAQLDRLRAHVRQLGSVLVCYSGGIDSALVLAVAHQELGAGALGFTAVSPSRSASTVFTPPGTTSRFVWAE